MTNTINTIIFDLGGVLIHWDPRRLYRKIFDTEAEIDYFLTHVCTSDWNEQQDAGRSLQEGTDLLVQQHPNYEQPIRAFYGRWEEMLGGPVEGTLNILEQLKQNSRYQLYALTNWSAETFPIAQERYGFLQWFKGILVSGHEGIKKPDPKIYQLILDRYGIDPATALFIDDNLRNVQASNDFGLPAVHFQSSEQLRKTLTKKGVAI